MLGLDVYSFIGWIICFFIFIFEGSDMVFAKNKSDKNDEIYAEYLKDKNRNNGYSVFLKNTKNDVHILCIKRLYTLICIGIYIIYITYTSYVHII